MSIKRQYLAILDSVRLYEELLEKTSEEQFMQNPPEGGWSYSEVMSHIFQSNLMSLVAIERCLIGTGVRETKSTPLVVKLILFFGILPPGKHKAPEKIASLVKKISREEARNLIVKFKQKLAESEPKAAKADRYSKVKHPRLGLLDSRQWFRFIQIHTKHHTKQLRRITASLKTVPAK